MRNVITFLSDFGQKDGYVGSVKGKILSINSKAKIVDISHFLTPFQIEEAAYVVSTYYHHFPSGAVHLAVVDPGVGSDRKSLILRTKKHTFVGPDNGLFSYIQKREATTAFVIKSMKMPVSSTFHARDIFGPAAALLAMGKQPEELGVKIDKIVTLKEEWVLCQNEINARVLSVDHFGTMITNFTYQDLKKMKGYTVDSVRIGGQHAVSFHRTYEEVSRDSALALWGSSGHLEIAINHGNAAHRFNCSVGVTQVSIRIKKQGDDRKI
jgi:S-adenosylmethionine hydrolase